MPLKGTGEALRGSYAPSVAPLPSSQPSCCVSSFFDSKQSHTIVREATADFPILQPALSPTFCSYRTSSTRHSLKSHHSTRRLTKTPSTVHYYTVPHNTANHRGDSYSRSSRSSRNFQNTSTNTNRYRKTACSLRLSLEPPPPDTASLDSYISLSHKTKYYRSRRSYHSAGTHL